MGKGSGSGRGSGGAYLRGGHAPRVNDVATPAIRHHSNPYMRKDGSSTSVHSRPKGLLNVGNSCYANAALQCLLSTALTHALIDPQASAIFRRYSSNPTLLEQGSGSVDSRDLALSETKSEDDGTERECRERRTLREKRRREREDRRLRENCTWLTRELKAITLDFLTPGRPEASRRTPSSADMLGWLSPVEPTVVVDPGVITRHPERLSKCLIPYQQEDAHEFMRALLSTLVMNGQNKKLSSLFDGLLESAVTCLHCRRPSLTRDRYMDLSLDICADHVETLTDALEEFTKTETLTGDNKVFCGKCGTKRAATKGLRLATAPSILVCHLKRFAFDSYGRLVRLSKRVKFPLRLEIGDYMSRVNKARPPPYELVAVLVHQGQTCDSGHYLAYVKNGGLWYKCNDSLVERVDVSTVLNQQAYILLYEVEEMRSKNGYSSPGAPSASGGTHRRPSSSGFSCRRDGEWDLSGWREYLLSTSMACGMDDSLLREFCWDVNGNNKNNSNTRRREGSVSGTSKSSGSAPNSTTRRRRFRGDASNLSIDSSYQDAHDDLSTLGESTVESSETASKIPFRRISSSGNLQTVDRYRPGSSHHSTGRPRQHFYTSTSDPDLTDYYRSKPWPAMTGSTSSSSNNNNDATGVDSTTTGASSNRAATRLRNDLPPRPESAAPSQLHLRYHQAQQQHRRSSSVGGMAGNRGTGPAEQQYNVY